MGQVSRCLRRSTEGYHHWCPACKHMHRLPDSWQFNGDLEKPTFTPSFLHRGHKRVFVDGRWTGEWVMDSAGKPIKQVCHYILTNGVLNFCGDCTHEMAGLSVPIPDLPPGHQDD